MLEDGATLQSLMYFYLNSSEFIVRGKNVHKGTQIVRDEFLYPILEQLDILIYYEF